MALLRVIEGPERGRIYPLEKDRHVIGRETDDLLVDDQGVSRQHAAVLRMGELYLLRDLDSRNGVFVNEERADEWILRAGDRVQIGNTVLVFEDRFARPGESRVIEFADTDGPSESIAPPADGERDRLRVLYRISKILGRGQSFDETMNKVARSMAVALDAEHVYLFAFEPTPDAEFTLLAGFDRTPIADLAVSRTILVRVRDEGRSILSSDAMLDSRFSGSKSIAIQKIKSLLCVPLVVMNQPVGAFYATNSKLAERFSPEDLELASVIGMLVGNSLEMWRLIDSQGSLYRQVLELLAEISEARSPEVRGRARRVATYSAAMARVLGYSNEATQKMWIAGLLHDIGTLGITEEELHAATLATRKAHKAKEILAHVPELSDVAEAVIGHTERIDGSGFPDGLSGPDVTEGAQIVGLACWFDEILSTGGEGGRELPIKEAVLQIQEDAAGKFDESVLDALLIAYRLNRLFEEDRRLFKLDLTRLVHRGDDEEDAGE
ncbi:MAG: FHA domain-containing protein [Planctomycetes bacterium]|nr:FHA domain-containing protein [Planctomycetota bacterium]